MFMRMMIHPCHCLNWKDELNWERGKSRMWTDVAEVLSEQFGTVFDSKHAA